MTPKDYAPIQTRVYYLCKARPLIPEGYSSLEEAWQELINTLKGILGDQEFAKIIPSSDIKDYLLRLNAKALELADQGSGNMPPLENIEYWDKQVKEQKALAQAHLARLKLPSLQNQIISAMAKFHATDDLKEIISADLVLQDPPPDLNSLAPLAEVSQKLELTEPLILPLEQLNLTVKNLRHSVGNLGLPPRVGDTLVLLKLIYPNLTPAQLSDQLHQLNPWLETKLGQSFDLTHINSQMLSILAGFNLKASGRELLSQYFTSQGMDPAIVSRMFQSPLSDSLFKTAIIIQDAIKDSSAQHAFLKHLHAGALAHSEFSPLAYAQVLEQVDWSDISSIYAQIGQEDQYKNWLNSRAYLNEQPNILFSWAQDIAQNYAQDFATNLALDAINQGPIGAWISSGITEGFAAFTLETASAAQVAAVAGATEATAVGAGTAAAGATAPTGPLAILIGILTAIGTFIATQMPIVKDIINWLWDKAKGLLKDFPLAIGLILGALGGILASLATGVSLAVAAPIGAGVGMGIQAAGTVFGSPSPTPLGNQIGNFITTVSTGFASAVTTEIILPALIIIISVPIVVALIMFIVNSSAFVVPTTSSLGLGQSGPVTLGPGGNYPYCWPVTTQNMTISGYLPGEGDHVGASYNAVDLGTPLGTKIYSTCDGQVVFAGWNPQGYGNLVMIQCKNSIVTYFAHQSRILASVGQQTPAGTQIGYSGSTGNSTGPHLHYEIRPNSLKYDYLVPLGNSCERRFSRGQISGCESETSGGANEEPKACHN